MDIIAIRAALRAPDAPTPAESVEEALAAFEGAVRRDALARAEAVIARRPSTLRATLKATTAVERARTDLLRQLRLLGEPPAPAADPPARLRLCP